jgi:hypothetical protein
MTPTTHRVSPTIAHAWLAGELHPAGPGFTLERMSRRAVMASVIAWTALIGTAAFLVGAVVSFLGVA